MPWRRVDLAQRFEEAGLGQQHALQRLDDHRRELVRVALDHRDRLRRLVERRDEHRLAGLRRHADRVGLRMRVVGRRARHRAPQAVVVHAVPRAFELQDLVAARERARDAQRIERRLGAGARVVDDVGAGNRLDEPLREHDLGLVQEVEGRAFRQLRRDRRGDRRMRVAEERRPELRW